MQHAAPAPAALPDLPHHLRPRQIGQEIPVVSFETSIDPEDAKLLLARNPANRRIDPRYVAQLAESLRAGGWKFNGEPIIVDAEGMLADGQHRLAAIVSTGISARTLVVVGIPTQARDTIDGGRKRTAANVLQMEGVGNASYAAAAAGYALRIERGLMGTTGGHVNLSREQIVDYVRKTPALGDAVTFCRNRFRQVGHQSLFAAILLECRRRDPVLADAFFLALSDGQNLSAGEPVYLLRQALLARSGGQRQLEEWVFGMTVKAWNVTRAQKRLRTLSYKLGTEEAPEIL